MIIFPFRKVFESAHTSSHANPFTIWSKKPTDQPALCPLAAGVASGTGAAAEAERRLGQAGGGEAPPSSLPWREVTFIKTQPFRGPLNITCVPWPPYAEGGTEQCRPGLCPPGPLGGQTHVRKPTTDRPYHWWWKAGSQPVQEGPACDATLLGTWPWLRIRGITLQGYCQVWSFSQKWPLLSLLCRYKLPISETSDFFIVLSFYQYFSSVDYEKQIYFEVSLTNLKNKVLHFLVSKTNF